MKGLIRRIHQDNGGFTLIELVIVIAILGVLMAVALPNFAGISNRGETAADKAELVTIQTAMDVMMAQLIMSSVNATSETTDMSAFPAGYPLYPNYLRSATTSTGYSCNVSGIVAQH